jgi:hypothetical protein
MYAIKIHTGTMTMMYRASPVKDPGCPQEMILKYDTER